MGSTFLITVSKKGGICIEKVFLTHEQLLLKLQQDKALIISDIDVAKQILEQINYYSLINGYKKPFKHSPSKKYIYGVTFDELVIFYYFDEALRSLFMKYILHIEQHMKSLLSYYFCQKHGENASEYLNETNYTLSVKNASMVNHFLHSIRKSLALPNPHSYIAHYVYTHDNIPLWVAINTFTFGQVSKMYQYISNDIQCKISQKFDHITERELHQFLSILARCRNICAHGERLFSFHTNEMIPDTPLHKKLGIPQKNGNFLYGKQDLFAVVIALRYLISPEDFRSFKADLSKLIQKVLKQCPHLTSEKLLKEMGFPDNWSKISRYKK